MAVLKESRILKNGLIFLFIASLMICVACTSYENAGYSFADPSSASTQTTAGITALNASFNCNMATEETLGSTSYQSFSMNRCFKNQSRIFFILQSILLTVLFIPNNILCTASFTGSLKTPSKALSIARYIELFDGKK